MAGTCCGFPDILAPIRCRGPFFFTAVPEARSRLRERLANLGLRVACLAGYTDFCLGAERPDIPSREMQVLYVRELCQLASLSTGLFWIVTP